jgi:hypothetical protein
MPKYPQLTICLLLVFIYSINTAHGVEIISSKSSNSGNTYFVSLEIHIDGTPDKVMKKLVDYENMEELNSTIKESTILIQHEGNDARVRQVLDTCFLFLCAQKALVQDYRTWPKAIEATMVPEQSSFKSGWSRWRVVPKNGGSRIFFKASLTPKFSIPPLFGSMIFKGKIETEAIKTFTAIEKLIKK